MGRTTRRFRIVGKVQGVYFRDSTRAQAQRLGIAGYARNLPDGSVEVLAQGALQAVEELRRWLHHGPGSARVDGVAELLVEAELTIAGERAEGARPGVDAESKLASDPAVEAPPVPDSGPVFHVR